LEEEVFSILKSFPPQTKYLAAVSGGADSMAMLSALSAVVNKDALFCLHVNHNIRTAQESGADAEFVRDFCEKRKIACHVETIPSGKIASYAKSRGVGIEAAARHFRRKALLEEAARLGADTRVLIAHTKDDLLETALMRILRGCGPAGLSAMPAENGIILRPLLSMTRAGVIAYLTENNIPWREDLSNNDEKFLRNKIRGRLVPLLNESFPSWKEGIGAMAQTQSIAAQFIASEAKSRVLWESRTDAKTQGNPELFTNEKNFFTQPLIIREEAVFQGINIFSSLCDPKSGHGSSKIKSIKRAVVRKFCAGNFVAESSAAAGCVNAADLGPVRIRRKKGKVLLEIISQ
jgi:tRNA(Ile)-lysidine synthase